MSIKSVVSTDQRPSLPCLFEDTSDGEVFLATERDEDGDYKGLVVFSDISGRVGKEDTFLADEALQVFAGNITLSND